MLEDFIEVNKLSAKIFFVPGKAGSSEQASNFVSSKMPVVKSILLIDSQSEPLLVILLGKDKIDFAKIKKLLNVADVRLATPSEVLKITGYEVGGVPPISIYGVKTFIDKKVACLDEIVCGGGTPEHLMQIRVKEIMDNVEDIKIADIAK
jgi:prolyl-tRNA editing enzyme YbaK/EbsC (Cys-tRNA(Pro) deacylase)